jgi:hypothetical protein
VRRRLGALAVLSLAVAVSPSRARPGRARLCIMADVSRGSLADAGLMRGLAERGRDDGRNLEVDYVQPYADAQQYEQLARRLPQRSCSVMLTPGAARDAGGTGQRGADAEGVRPGQRSGGARPGGDPAAPGRQRHGPCLAAA